MISQSCDSCNLQNSVAWVAATIMHEASLDKKANISIDPGEDTHFNPFEIVRLGSGTENDLTPYTVAWLVSTFSCLS